MPSCLRLMPGLDDEVTAQVIVAAVRSDKPIISYRTECHNQDKVSMGTIAARDCFKKAFMKAGPMLLEPYMSIEVTSPEEYVGSIVGDICSKRGKVLNMDTKGKQQVVSAEAPLAEMFGYATGLRSISSGRATYSMHFEKYIEVPFAIAEKIVEEANKPKEKS